MMGNSEKISYVMLFFALLVAKNSKMQLKDLLLLFPFHGKAQFLAQQLASVAPTGTGNESVPGETLY